MKILRSMLYVPANSWRMITNAVSEGADAVILDLEDGCPMAEKETGRVFARDSLPILKEQDLEVYVRINSLETGLPETDISYVVTQGLDGIMLAKTESKEDIVWLDKLIQKEERKKGLEPNSTTIVALVETPKGILNLSEIISASKRVEAIAFGAGDFSREMGAGMGVSKLTPEEYFTMVLFARSSIALTARATGVQAIDTPFFGLVIDLEGLRDEAEKVRLLGFSGKQLTHPRHVAIANEVFSPAKEEIDLAKQVVDAYKKAMASGLGATTIGGRMIDLGSFKRAEGILQLAETIKQKEKATREGSD